jgi:hypothetical protein
MAEAGSGMLSRELKPRRLEREVCGGGVDLSGVSRERCSRLRGGGGERAAMPVGMEFGAGDWVAIRGISPEVGVGVVRVE